MSTYCVQADIEATFGAENVDTWSDLDSDGNASNKAARITASIAYASARIDDVARTVNHAIPLANASSATPTTVTYLAAMIAGLWLYESRGSQDFNPQTGQPYHRLAFRRIEARRMLEEIRTSAIKLDAL